MRSRSAAAGGVLLLSAVASLAACGEAGSGPGADAGAAGSADGPSYGVDQASWPDSLDAARGLVDALPGEVAGETRDEQELEPEFAAEHAFASYGGGALSVMASDGSFSGVPSEDTVAQDKLAAMFGLVYGCDTDTYAGSIGLEGVGPGMSRVPDGEPAWFACRVDGAEGAEDLTAEAVGWTSGTEVAWLVVAPDEDAVRDLVTAMREGADG